jgi:hypothetical protein
MYEENAVTREEDITHACGGWLVEDFVRKGDK